MKTNQEIRRTLTKVAIVTGVLVLMDLTIGTLTQYVFFKQTTGKYARIRYALDDVTEDMVIFGSSHAMRHYIPEYIEKATHLSCYNAGSLNQRMLYQTTVQEAMLTHHRPRYIVLNVDHHWLTEDHHTYELLADLNPYYEEYPQIIGPALRLNKHFEEVKLRLKAYRFNSTLVHIIKYGLSPQPDVHGYVPVYATMPVPDDATPEPPPRAEEEPPFDPNFVDAYRRFIANAETHDIGLVMVISPEVKKVHWRESRSLHRMLDIAREHNVPVVDFADDSHFVEQYALFKDYDHLNHAGAVVFSTMLADSLTRLIHSKGMMHP